MKKTTKTAKTTSRKAVATRKATTPKPTKLQTLKTKERDTARAMKTCASTWEAKRGKAKTAEKRKAVDTKYSAQFNKLANRNKRATLDVQICKLQNEKRKLG